MRPGVALPWPSLGVAEVWHLDMGAMRGAVSAGLQWLDEAERKRSERFVSESARATFLTARYALRSLLARYLGADPAGIRLETNAYGKPRLGPGSGAQGLYFNLSHSGDGLLIAFARCELGVDIQCRVHPRTLVGLRASLSPREASILAAQADSATAAEQVLDWWSRKEALVKAVGLGLSLDPRQIAVPTSATCLNVAVPVEGHGNWWLSSLSLGADVHAAVAVAAPCTLVRLREPGL